MVWYLEGVFIPFAQEIEEMLNRILVDALQPAPSTRNKQKKKLSGKTELIPFAERPMKIIHLRLNYFII